MTNTSSYLLRAWNETHELMSQLQLNSLVISWKLQMNKIAWVGCLFLWKLIIFSDKYVPSLVFWTIWAQSSVSFGEVSFFFIYYTSGVLRADCSNIYVIQICICLLYNLKCISCICYLIWWGRIVKVWSDCLMEVDFFVFNSVKCKCAHYKIYMLDKEQRRNMLSGSDNYFLMANINLLIYLLAFKI